MNLCLIWKDKTLIAVVPNHDVKYTLSDLPCANYDVQPILSGDYHEDGLYNAADFLDDDEIDHLIGE